MRANPRPLKQRNFACIRRISNGAHNSLRQVEGMELIWAIFVILLAGWGAGVMNGTNFGGSLHLLLVAAAALLLLDTLTSGRREPG